MKEVPEETPLPLRRLYQSRHRRLRRIDDDFEVFAAVALLRYRRAHTRVSWLCIAFSQA